MSKEDVFPVDGILQIIANNIVENVVLQKDMVEYVEAKERELIRKCEKLERQVKNLQNENAELQSKLTAYESTVVMPKQSSDSHQLLTKFYQEITYTLNKLIRDINESRSLRETELSKCAEEYDKCTSNLDKLNLKISYETFGKMIRDYKKVCDENDQSRKENFKQLYELAKMSKDKVEEDKTLTVKHNKEIEAFVRSNKKKLEIINDMIFSREFLREKQIFEDAISIGKKEITLITGLFSNSTATSGKEEPYQRLSSHSDDVQIDSKEQELVVFYPANGQNMQQLLDSINGIEEGLALSLEDIVTTKTFDGRTYTNLTKITLPSGNIVNKIMKGEKKKQINVEGNSIPLWSYNEFRSKN